MRSRDIKDSTDIKDTRETKEGGLSLMSLPSLMSLLSIFRLSIFRCLAVAIEARLGVAPPPLEEPGHGVDQLGREPPGLPPAFRRVEQRRHRLQRVDRSPL